MKVAGYARVSTDLQREKETIKTQVELIEQLCIANNHTLTNIYCDDGVSGTIHLHDRPGGARLLADARDGKFEAIAVYKADRIGRDVLVNETAARSLHDELGIVFLGISEQIDLATPIGRAMFTFQSAIGRLERESTLQRSMDATRRYARDGVWLGGIVPFGYRVEGKDREARLHLADEVIPEIGMSEADVVRDIYRMAGEEELSCVVIADRLNAKGVPTHYARDNRQVVRNKRKQRTRGVWRSGRVRNMIAESTYKGIHHWGRRGSKRRPKGEAPATIERAVPAIVDAELWERAQQTLQKNRIIPANSTHRLYLLRGLMKCSLCGLTYVGSVNKGHKAELLSPDQLLTAEISGGRVLRRYYLCNGKNLTHQIYGELDCRCPSGAIRAQELEEIIWQDVETFLRQPGTVLDQLREKLQDRFANTDALGRLVENLESDAGAKEDERSSLFRLYRRGGISEADLEQQMREVAAEEGVLRAEAERLRSEMQKAEDATRSLTSAEALLVRLHAKLQGELPWETKRKIIEALVERIEIDSQSSPGSNGFPSARRRVPKVTVRYCFDEAVSGLAKSGRAINERAINGRSKAGQGDSIGSNGAQSECTEKGLRSGAAPSVSNNVVTSEAQAKNDTGVPAVFMATKDVSVNAALRKFVVI